MACCECILTDYWECFQKFIGFVKDCYGEGGQEEEEEEKPATTFILHNGSYLNNKEAKESGLFYVHQPTIILIMAHFNQKYHQFQEHLLLK